MKEKGFTGQVAHQSRSAEEKKKMDFLRAHVSSMVIRLVSAVVGLLSLYLPMNIITIFYARKVLDFNFLLLEEQLVLITCSPEDQNDQTPLMIKLVLIGAL